MTLIFIILNGYLIRNVLPNEFDWATFYGIFISSAISLSVSIYLVYRSKKMTDDTIKANFEIAYKAERNKYACHFNFQVSYTNDIENLLNPQNNIIIKCFLLDEMDINNTDNENIYYIKIVNVSNNICKIRLEDVIIKSISTDTELDKEVINSRLFALLGNRDYIVVWFNGNHDFETIHDIMKKCSIEFRYINQLGDKIYVKSETINDNILKEYKEESINNKRKSDING